MASKPAEVVPRKRSEVRKKTPCVAH